MKKDQQKSVGDKKVRRSRGVLEDSAGQQQQAGAGGDAVIPVQPGLGADGLAFEEEQAATTNALQEFRLFKATCNQIRQCMKEILECKKANKPDEHVLQLRVDASMHFLVLKKLNRLDKYRSKKARDAVNEVKQKVDNFHLQLQNLLYEAMHLQKEVTKCLEFRSKDEEIDLIPIEEFYREAPESTTRPHETRKDVHQLTLARLEWELEQREKLAVKLKETEDLKQVYIKEIENKKECLENLQPTLKSILEATQPLHKELGMPLQAMHLEHNAAEFLPRPLYVLYVQVLAYRQACDSKIGVSVDGNVEEARAMQMPAEVSDEESGESDQEDAGPVKRHRRSTTDQREEGQKKVLKKHPLSVLITVKDCDGDVSLLVQFFYLLSLHIVSVKTKLVCHQQLHGVFAPDVLATGTLLHCLFPNDDGNESPNPANYFQLKNIGVKSIRELIPQLGNPFRWSQRLTGLEFLPPGGGSHEQGVASTSRTESSYSISSSFIEQTIAAIKSRLHARLALYSQVSSLERGVFPSSPQNVPFLTAKISSHITGFTKVTWEDFMAHPCAEEFVELGMKEDASLTFQVVVERGSAKLVALVLVSAEYPQIPPLFLLTLLWKTERTSHTDDSILALEEEVNVRCVEQLQMAQMERVFACQLQHLLVCFDIFLETDPSESTVEGPREFPQGKIVTQKARGRNHARPYKYLSKFGLFTHW